MMPYLAYSLAGTGNLRGRTCSHEMFWNERCQESYLR